ncbi:hypothetical protein [Ligilactobacillus araffinosus]|uniref:Uncharacterized protein n=1 Tax=Ligilactobacillus araffinosus DSM 20653 TaxID=1423820 RepID=A0A0R1ZBR6_9LACO|nr:hypothetical protein [Ligilactobacillus araffinosus]KRM52352.1 hypothetical protein FC64_GL000779 [Ligilactobacillus araffinosus DSM 20653]
MDKLINQVISVLVGISVFTILGMLLGIIKTTLGVAIAPFVVALVVLVVNWIIQKFKKKEGK